MHAVVIYQNAWGPLEETARLVAGELGVRAIAFERRPDMAMYDLVVLGTSPLGLWDPRLLAFLAGGQLRGKTVAFFHDVTAPWADALLEPWHNLAALGGAIIYRDPLIFSSSLFSGLSDTQRASASAWGAQLLAEFPPPRFPRGSAGRRVV